MTSQQYRNWNGLKMEAEFVAHYLGASMLNKVTTGLGAIQKPLKEKYFAFRKSAENKLGPEIGIRVNPSGLTLLFPGTHPGHENEDFYEISSIHFAEAVRFVHMKFKDKKTHYAFVPLDESHAANAGQEKLFTQLDKKFKHLEKISHPPMLASVMRRATGVKAVDCHVFVFQHPEDALQIASMVRRFQAGPGFYDRRSYGPPATGPARRDYPGPDVIPQNREPPRELASPREQGDDYAIYRGRGLELRNEHFRSNDPPQERREFEPNRSFERNPSGFPGYDRKATDDRFRQSYGDDRVGGERGGDSVEMRPREYRTDAAIVERDSYGREYQFDNAISHGRQKSGDSGSGRPRYGSEKTGAMSPRNEYGGRPERHSDIIPQGRYNQYPNRADMDQFAGGRPVSGNLRDEPPLRRSYHDQNFPRPMGPQSPPHSPRSPMGERSPPATRSPRARSPPPEEEVCSASNLESRQEVDAHGKPIAKVPPNRHAGVRVLPSLPIPGARSQLKPVTPPPDLASPNEKDIQKGPSYNFDSRDDSDSDNPYDNALAKLTKDEYARKDRLLSDESAFAERRMENRRNQDASRVKSDGFNYGSSVYTSASPRPNNRQTEEPKQWSFHEEKEKFMQKDKKDGWQREYKSKSAYEFSPPNFESGYGNAGQHGAKDAEIADMFSKMRAGPGARHDVDFERGLGYLP